jgi:hypothetical protein
VDSDTIDSDIMDSDTKDSDTIDSHTIDPYLRNTNRAIYNVVKQVPRSSHCSYRYHFQFSLKYFGSLIGQALARPNVSPVCHRLT